MMKKKLIHILHKLRAFLPTVRLSAKDRLERRASRSRRLLYFFGINLHVGKWQLRFQPRFFIVVGCGVLAGLFALGGMVRYSETPGFCNSCHIMKPYYNAWASSAHNKIACVECHYPPASKKTLLWKKFQAMSQVVKYVTRTYSSKPFAEVDDESCLRSGCHSTRLLEGRVESKLGIKFDHRPHLTQVRRGRHLKCVSCHSQMVVGKHVEVTYDTCYLCHFKKMGSGRDLAPLGGCTGCHELPRKSFKVGNMVYNHKEFVVDRGVSCQSCHIDVVRGTGEAKQDRCFTCHNQPEKLAKYDDEVFLHENHVTKHNVACFHCHQEIRHGGGSDDGSRLAPLETVGMAAPSSEGGPHGPTLTFQCSFCHTEKHAGTLEMYSGKVKNLGLQDIPSPMFLANVDCVGCHFEKKTDADGFRGTNFLSSRDSCVKCHGPRFQGIWEETAAELSKAVAALENKLSKARKALETAALPEKEREKLEASLRGAARWQSFVRISRGEHNVYLASDVLRRENAVLDEVAGALKTSLPDVSEDPLISGNYCAVLCHPRVGVRVPPETVRTGGKMMPHKMHAEMMGCVKCHVIGEHKEVPLRKGVKKEVCGTCHE